MVTEAVGARRRWGHRLFRHDPDRSTRRASDVVRVIAAGVIFAVLAVHAGHEGEAERSLVRFVSSLSDALRIPVVALYGLAVLWVVGLIVVAILIGRRWRLARDVGVAAVLTWVVARLLGTVLQGVGLGDAMEDLTRAGSSPRFPLTRVAIVTAAVLVASPHLTRPVRRIGQVLIGVFALAALYLATAFPGDLLGAIVLGWAVAAIVHLVFGVPMGRPTPEQVRAALARLRIDAHGLRRCDRQPIGAAAFSAVDDVGALDVTVLGRDEVDAQLFAKIWRWAVYRHQGSVLFVTRRQQAEHEAYALLLARSGGARVPMVVAAGAATPRLALVATRSLDGSRLPDLGSGISDAVLGDVWQQLVVLHASGVAHGRLSVDAVVVGPEGPGFVDLAAATTTPDDRQCAADVAELLCGTAAIVGVGRAVAAATGVVDSHALVAALPLMQGPALTSSTRDAIGGGSEREQLLADLRGAIAGAAGVEVPDVAKLERVRLRTIAMTVGTLFALFALLSRIGDPAAFWQTIRDATWGYVLLAFVAALLTNLAFTVAFLGTVPMRFDFWPVVWLQTAMGFSNVALPSGAESAVQVRFLQKHGLDLASALAVGGVLSTISEFAVQLGLFGIAVLLAPSDVDIGDVPVGSMAAVIAVVVLVLGVAAAVVFGVRRIRHKVLPHVLRAARTMWDAVRSPTRVALLIVGNVAAQILYTVALLACLLAFGASASFWTLLALNIGISTIAGLVPIPGGDTAVSTIGMSGALVAIGVPESAAAAAVLTNAIVTGYLPAIPGWFATNYLVRTGQL